MLAGLHHVEFCVSDGLKVLKEFTERYRFVLRWSRETESCKQWVASLSRNQLRPAFVITERKDDQEPENDEEWTNFCCGKSNHRINSGHNVSLFVKNVEECTKVVQVNGGSVIKAPRKISDAFGYVWYSIVSSPCGNVVHTLINRENYDGAHFLPLFKEVPQGILNEDAKCQVTGVDHVAFHCYRGTICKTIDWYARVFGMKRFIVNSQETLADGMMLGDNVGLRMMVMEYWLCAETCVKSKCPDGSTLMFVFGESLEGYKTSHVETFLREHGGPGLQHLAMASSDICSTVKTMTGNKVAFRRPPDSYYTLSEKAMQISESGEDLEDMKKYGIMLDADSKECLESKYLMQIFTKPVFDEETFFFEVIQRKGATGFGEGNIIALTKCIERDNKKKRSEELNTFP